MDLMDIKSLAILSVSLGAAAWLWVKLVAFLCGKDGEISGFGWSWVAALGLLYIFECWVEGCVKITG